MTSRAAEADSYYSDDQRPAVLRGRQIDLWLLGAVLGLLGLGIVMVFDASYFLGAERFGDAYALVRRQAVFICMSAALAYALSHVEPAMLKRYAYPALLAGLVLLVLVLIPGIGQIRGGARRWISLGLFAFEPSELMKPLFVLYLARSLSGKQEKMHDFFFGVLPHLVMMCVPILLLMLEPDFGASAVITVVTLAMLFTAGASLFHLGLLGAAVVPPAVGGAAASAVVASAAIGGPATDQLELAPNTSAPSAAEFALPVVASHARATSPAGSSARPETWHQNSSSWPRASRRFITRSSA